MALGRTALRVVLALALTVAAGPAHAQTCLMTWDVDAGAKAALEQSARQFFDMAARSDLSAMRAGAIASVASNFGAIETAVVQNKPNLAGATAAIRSLYVLDAPGTTPIVKADFYCGAYPDLVIFELPNLPPGRYAVAIMDASGGKAPVTLSLVLQQEGARWMLAGFYLHPKEMAGHNGDWYREQAQQIKARGDAYSAWFYYLTAWQLLAPVDFMSTAKLDKLADEMQQVRPTDLPSPSAPMRLIVNGRTVNITDVNVISGSDGLQLAVRYQAADVSDLESTRTQNLNVGRALAGKFPGFREAFTAIVAYAVDPQGRAFWSSLAMKDVK